MFNLEVKYSDTITLFDQFGTNFGGSYLKHGCACEHKSNCLTGNLFISCRFDRDFFIQIKYD